MQQYGKYYITLKGVHYEVSQEVHDAFYQAERQERYMAEKDQSHNLVILNISGMEELEEGRNQEHLASSQHGMESELIKKEMVEHLHQCLQMLPKAERDLIYAIFYEEETEASYAERVGLTYEQIINFAQIHSYFSSEFGLISEGVFTASLNLDN